ncbi:MAG: HlyC/CorC family transporter [Deltaproteobacteria bacterium]|nr:MAG: HlyC/CorC family transporter [Deltaproteobacteria bacterium]
MGSLIAVVIAVIVISATCSLFEAVLYAVPASHVESLSKQGRSSGKVLEQLRERIDEPIAAILSLNTIANTAGAAVAGALASQALGEGNLVAFSAAFTLAILLFSEIIPKTVGVVHNRLLAGIIARPLAVLVLVFKPLIWLVGTITRLIGSSSGDTVSTEEIVSLARLGTRAGTIDADEAAVIQNILSLSERRTRQIMTPRTVVFSLQADMTAAAAWEDERLMVHARIPVHDEDVDDIVGVVYRRDVLAAEPERTIASLVRPVDFVGEREPVDRLLELLLAHSRHLFVVVDEFGGFAGVVTLEDVMEEILGKEIVDEFDVVSDMRALAMERKAMALSRMQGDAG